MGCRTSKQARHDLQCHSLPSHHNYNYNSTSNRRLCVCESGYHIVPFTTSALAGIRLEAPSLSHRETDDAVQKIFNIENYVENNIIQGGGDQGDGGGDLSSYVTDAKIWSDRMEKKIQTTSTRASSNDHLPEVIDVSELMAGLEDTSPACRTDNVGRRSLSFNATLHDAADAGPGSSIPNIKSEKLFASASPLRISLVKERTRAFQKKIDARKADAQKMRYKCPPGGEDKVVLYFTSLRGIRKTHENCLHIQQILRGYGVRLDERDVSMHSGYKDELNEILGPGFGGCALPRVFVAGRYLGGSEDVKPMHESDELAEALEGVKLATAGKVGEWVGPCQCCNDMRFVPCGTCSGSRKLYAGENNEEEYDESEEVWEFRRCPDCNENGLVRCPMCCDG